MTHVRYEADDGSLEQAVADLQNHPVVAAVAIVVLGSLIAVVAFLSGLNIPAS